MWSYAPFKGHNGILNQDISKTITARSFKLGQLIEDNESIIWCKLKEKSFLFFGLLPFANWDIENLISQTPLQLGASNLVSL